jgi:hypothetical protein
MIQSLILGQCGRVEVVSTNGIVDFLRKERLES